MPQKRFIVTLSRAERKELEETVSKGRGAVSRIKHAHILLAADENGPNWKDEDIAETFRCHRNTVANVRQRFVEEGLEEALERKKRETPPVSRLLDGRGEARLIAAACSEPPKGFAQWTMQLLADTLVVLGVVESISDETVRRTLKKTNLSRICGNVG
jgi:transposase